MTRYSCVNTNRNTAVNGNFLMGADSAKPGNWGSSTGNPPVGKGPNCDKPRKSYRSHRAKLTSVRDVSAELAKLYRESRAGKINVADASRLANILAIQARIMSDGELEARIEALEVKGFH
jgi:hypothetical protein